MLAALSIILLPLLLPATPSGSASPQRDRDNESGAAAPAGRWYVRGGCAARTGVSLASPIRTEPEVAWSLPVRGEIEDQPLVWDERVVLSVLEPRGRRSILITNLTSGELLASMTLVASQPLRPALWGSFLAVQPEAGRIDIYRISTRRPILVRSFETRESFSSPLLFEEALYVREGDELVRYDLNLREPRWRVRASGKFRGSPSLRGGFVYAIYSIRNATAEILDF